MTRLTSVPDLDEELDRLYGLPLGEFVAARDDLGKRLRAAGLGDRADEVKGLRKPPASVWIVNQLARKCPEAVAALAGAGEQLAAAQAESLGSGGGERFAHARSEHTATLTRVGRHIGTLLHEAGRTATQATSERALRTLRAASLDAEARRDLVAGRLRDGVETGGFSLLAGLEVPAGKPRRQARPAAAKEELEALRLELKDARREAGELRRRAATKERSAVRARQEADRAGEAAAEAEAAARQAEAAVEELEGKLARLTAGKR